jgi:hypothetical protein
MAPCKNATDFGGTEFRWLKDYFLFYAGIACGMHHFSRQSSLYWRASAPMLMHKHFVERFWEQ